MKADLALHDPRRAVELLQNYAVRGCEAAEARIEEIRNDEESDRGLRRRNGSEKGSDGEEKLPPGSAQAIKSWSGTGL